MSSKLLNNISVKQKGPCYASAAVFNTRRLPDIIKDYPSHLYKIKLF